jgi:hypothetical protein
MQCAELYPQFPVVVSLSEPADPPTPSYEVTTRAGTKSLVLNLGKKGKYIGVVGVWKTNKPEQPYTFKFERVEMTEDYLTPKAKEKDHPIVELMEAYGRDLKSQNYLQRVGQVKHKNQALPKVEGLKGTGEATFVGSEKCKSCHRHAHRIWEKTPHAHAYDTLVKATRPGYRQFDPECIVCHTVGFGYISGFETAEKTPLLKDVGCESCHGPCSVHVANKNDVEWHKRINPWKYIPNKQQREFAIDQFCQKCHDEDNDVTWTNRGFQRKWPKVEHNTPPAPKD